MNRFDQVAKTAKEEMEFHEGWKKIWTEVFSLDKILVAIQKPVEEQDYKEPLLFLGTIDDAPCVFAFSDKEHYEDFHEFVQKKGDERELSYHEVSVDEFLNFTNHITQNIPTLMMNFGNDYGFHTDMNNIVPMYSEFMKGEPLQPHQVKEGTTINVAVPDEIEEMKKVVLSVKDKYKSKINRIAPLIATIEGRTDTVIVIKFQEGLTVEDKKNIMKNLHQDLQVSPLFQIPLNFTEDEFLVPSQIAHVAQVSF